MFFWKFRLGWISVVAMSLVLSLSHVSAQEEDVGDLMNGMEKSFIELVRNILVVPVQESGDEPNFTEVGKLAGEVVKIAGKLPVLEDYKDDKDFRNNALTVENLGRSLTDLAKKKDAKAAISALVKLQAACLKCHNSFRF